MIGDMEKLRNHLGYKKWSILGHSFGGILASAYSARHPGRVKKLILSASGGVDLDFLNYVGQSVQSRLSRLEQDSLAHYTNLIGAGDTSKSTLIKRATFLAPAYLYDKKHVPVISERLTQLYPVINQLVIADLQKIKYDVKKQLSHFSAPTLIIQGKQDIILGKTALASQQSIRNSKLILLDKCSHYGWLDVPHLYFKEIFDFLQ